MFNIPYFKQTIKSNFKFLMLFTAVLCVFLIVMSYVFTPETMEGLQSSTKGTIAGNILSGNGTLVGFMSNSFYALMAIIFPMVYSIMVANRMIALKIDKGIMTAFLSTPTKRSEITVTDAVYLIFSLIIMWSTASIIGILAAEKFQPGALDIETFLLLNLGAFLYHLAISSICFCSSCIFNTSKNSLSIGAGVPLTFFVISLFIKLSPDLDFLKYFTLNTLFNPQNILQESGYITEFIIMTVISIVLYIIGIIWFKKKDLPL